METQIKSIISAKIVSFNHIINDIKSFQEKYLFNQRKDILNKYNKDDFYDEKITVIF